MELVPPTRAFVEELFNLASRQEIPWQWRGPETPKSFDESMWDGVLVQYAIRDTVEGRMVGIVRADNFNSFHRYAYVTMLLLPDYRLRAWPLEGALLFGNYLFRRFDLEHLYAEVPATYLGQFKSGIGRVFEVEGQLRNRVVINGERQDLYILTFSREQAMQAAGLVERMSAGAGNGRTPTG